MREVVAIVLVTACGYSPARLDPTTTGDAPPTFDGNVITPDAPIDGGLVGPPPTACVASWLAGTMTFSNTAFVGGTGILTNLDERDPFVSFDGRVLYYVRPNGSDDDILFAVRQQASGPFSNLLVKGISAVNANDGKVTITDDDLTAIVSTARNGGAGGFDLWLASRATGFDAAFDTISQEHLGALNNAGNQVDPHISEDGLRLYYTTGAPQQIVVSERAATTVAFPASTVLANVNGINGDADPTLTGDERVLIFTSNRDSAANSSQLFYATRAERDQPFGAPLPLSINTAFEDGDPHISLDGCTLYFATTRAGTGDYDLVVTTVQ